MIDWLALIRSIHIAASILLAAVFAFPLIVLKPVTSGCREIDKFQPWFKATQDRLAVASWIMVIFSGFAWFELVAASIAGEVTPLGVSPEALKIILLQTQFGHLWLVRSGFCLAMGWLFFSRRREPLKALFSLAILGSLAWAGHAGANGSSAGLVALAGDLGHLTAAALWPGGLVPLVFVLCRERRAADNQRFVAEVVRRFSAVSLVVVAFLGATGVLNAYFIVGSVRALYVTPYGQLLLVKIALFLLMIGLGAWNLLIVKPGLIRLAMVESQRASSAPKLVESLVRSVTCETILAGGVLLVVGFLGVTPPPMH
jgi:putative copper resistance protein D